VSAWGPPERSQVLTDLLPTVRPLMPPPPPGAHAGGPGALSAPGALAALLTAAGLRLIEDGDVSCPFVFPDAEASFRAHASTGPNQVAVGHCGEEAVRASIAEADRAHARPDGSIRYENVFIWAAGAKA
jgi:hypothetical protein